MPKSFPLSLTKDIESTEEERWVEQPVSEKDQDESADNGENADDDSVRCYSISNICNEGGESG